jgi:phage tail sheath protein FI
MPASFLHGVEIIEIQSGAIPVRTLRSSVIGIVGTAPGADPAKFPLNTPVLIAASRVEAAGLSEDADGNVDTSGTLPRSIDAILAQGGASIVVVRVDEGATDDETATNIIGGVTGGVLTGAQSLVSADSILGVQPRILLAPGYTHRKAVADELLSLAERLRGIVIIEGPNTVDTDVIAYRDEFDSDRGFLIDPAVKAFVDGADAVVPASPYVAGLIAKIDSDKGFWWSPSNNVLLGVTGTARPIDFLLGDENSRANLLNEHEVTTIIRESGYRLWGNRTLQATSPRFAFLPIRRTADIINDSLQRASLPFVDNPINKALVESITDTVNNYLRDLVSQGAILGGECWFDRDANGDMQLADGKVRFRYKFQPPTPAEHIIYESQVVTEYFDVLFK